MVMVTWFSSLSKSVIESFCRICLGQAHQVADNILSENSRHCNLHNAINKFLPSVTMLR